MEEGPEGGEAGQAGPSADVAPPVAGADDPTPEHGAALITEPAEAITERAWHRLVPFAVVVVVGSWLTRPFWKPGSYVVGFDTYAYSGPNLEVTERALRNWRLPILDDLIFGGVPHLGNPSALALYPPQLLTIPFGTNRAMGLLVAAHVVLLGVGMVVLTRRLGVGRVGATAGGVAAMAAGATLTKSIQFEQILVVSWIPLLLASIHAVLTGSRPGRAIAALSATTAAILLAGHPQLVYQTVIVAVAATIGFAWDDGRWRRLGHVAGGAALGACIALPQLVAVLAATSDSALQGGRSTEELLAPGLSLIPRATTRALIGTVQDRDPAVFAGGFESIGFVGVAMAVLAVVGLVQGVAARRSRPWSVALAATALLALVWAWGPRTPVFDLAFELLPGFDLARASARWVVVVTVITAIFAAVGVDVVWRGARRRHAAAAAGAVAAVAVLLVVDVMDVADGRSAWIWFATALVMLALVAGSTAGTRRSVVRGVAVALLIVGAAELALMSNHSFPLALATDTPFTEHRSATTEYLAEAGGGLVVALTDDGAPVAYSVAGLRPNANVLSGIASIDGYDGGVQITRRWADALRRFQVDPPTELPLRNSLTIPLDPAALARLGVRYVLLDNDRPADAFVPGWTGPVAGDADFTVFENPEWLGEAVVWPAAIASDDPAQLLREEPEVASRAAIVTDPDLAFACSGSPCRPGAVDIDRPRPERIELTVDASGPSIVSVPQQALPGWTVEVDGEPADVVEVDGLFLGVRLDEGPHDVVFQYRSPALTATLLLSVVALAVTVLLAVWGTIPGVRRRPRVGTTDDQNAQVGMGTDR